LRAGRTIAGRTSRRYHRAVSLLSLSPRGIFQVRVIENVPLCREHYRVTFAVDGFPPAQPGQFIQIDCRAARPALGRPRVFTWSPGDTGALSVRETVLRRPFSIGGLRRRGDMCELDIIGRTIGPGTRRLAALGVGEATEIIGPLGRPFTIDDRTRLAIIVAGGVGLPPLLWLAERLNRRGLACVAICGARTAELLPLTLSDRPHTDGRESRCAVEFDRVGAATIVTTDDGTLGLRGTTADALAALLKRRAERPEELCVYTCGPEPMMRRVAAIGAERGIACQAALERVMGCGMGTCQSCVVRIRDRSDRGWHYELCCTQGPVFDAAAVDWSTPNQRD
jgi:dihydroorotate dehydrogenase electron transfer subunit